MHTRHALGQAAISRQSRPRPQGFANLTQILGLNNTADLLIPENAEVLGKILRYHVLTGAPVLPPALKVGARLRMRLHIKAPAPSQGPTRLHTYAIARLRSGPGVCALCIYGHPLPPPHPSCRWRRPQGGQKLATSLDNALVTVDKTVPGITHLVGGSPLNVVTLLGYQQVAGDKAQVYVTDQVLIPPELVTSVPQLAKLFALAQPLGRKML